MRPFTAGVLTAASFASAGCFTMKPTTLTDLGAAPSARVWVTRADQSTVIVYGPRVVENRLVGYVNNQYLEMPVTDVTLVVARRMAPGRTGAMVAAGIVGAAAVIAILSGGGQAPDPCISGAPECPFPR